MEKNFMLIKLVDGAILRIETDEEHWPGCETCDFGSHYINNFVVTLTKHKIVASIDQMYEFVFSSGDLMNIILPKIEEIMQMTEIEFCGWFEGMLEKQKEKTFLSDCKVKFKVETLAAKDGADSE